MKKPLHNIINEAVSKVLKEYIQPSFDPKYFKELAKNGVSRELMAYCTKHLGENVGEGTSRMVFDYTDNVVLKLAKSNDGRRQNMCEEIAVENANGNPLVPRIYYMDSNYIWMLAEAVLPAKEEDFEKILGIPYGLDGIYRSTRDEDKWDYSDYNSYEQKWEQDEDYEPISLMGFIDWYKDYLNGDIHRYYCDYVNESYQTLMKRPWFQYLIELFELQDIDEFFLSNFGIAMRNNKPTIVVLDMGWGEEK